MIRIFTVLGARPQFIKASALSSALAEHGDTISETIIHSGQHYDENMSEVFFKQLRLTKPKFTLQQNVHSGHASMTGNMMSDLEGIFNTEKPDLVLVYGDTNTTLAASLAAVKVQIPVVHVEAGLRSNNMRMPEEINRIIVDRISALNLAPSEKAMNNLKSDGLIESSLLVGDIMHDVIKNFSNEARLSTKASLEVPDAVINKPFVFATCHRGETTDNQVLLTEFFKGLNLISKELPIVLPMHPRLKSVLAKHNGTIRVSPNVHMIDPLDFFSSIFLQKRAKVVLTDSGGIQKESFYLETPCVTFREETEWTETIDLGWNRLSQISSNELARNVFDALSSRGQIGNPYGRGDASKKIIDSLLNQGWINQFK